MNRFFNFCSLLLTLLLVLAYSCNNKTASVDPQKGDTALTKSDTAVFKTTRLLQYEKQYDSISKLPDFDSTKSQKIAETIDSMARNSRDTLSATHSSTRFGVGGNDVDTSALGKALAKADNYLKNFSAHSGSSTQLNTASVVNAQSQDIHDVERGIIWLFDEAGNGAPTRLESWTASVKWFGFPFIRGYIGARSCGDNAVLMAVCGYNDDALTWLQAAQSHNAEESALFAKYSDYAINFAIKNYGTRALIESGIPYYAAYGAIRDALVGKYTDYHPAPYPPVPPEERAQAHNGDRAGGRN